MKAKIFTLAAIVLSSFAFSADAQVRRTNGSIFDRDQVYTQNQGRGHGKNNHGQQVSAVAKHHGKYKDKKGKGNCDHRRDEQVFDRDDRRYDKRRDGNVYNGKRQQPQGKSIFD